jgi:hypothetical protein
VLRSAVFPGLWLEVAACLGDDGARVRAALERDMATAEHAAFVARLGAVGPHLGT